MASRISNPNTPFEQNRPLPCGLFCFFVEILRNQNENKEKGIKIFAICSVAKSLDFRYNKLRKIIGREIIFMYYRNSEHTLDNYTFGIFDMYFKNYKICVLDIETTGLSPERSHFILGGLLSLESNGNAQFSQYFAESLSEEKEILIKYLKEVATHDIVVTYNGRNFDIPFLLTRAKKMGIEVENIPYNLDLYLVLNGHSPLRKLLPNLKQKTIENFMGLWAFRSDRISGAESVTLYNEYLVKKRKNEDTAEHQDLLLLHNQDDVLQLSKLFPVLEKTDFHKAMYTLGFPVISGDKKLFVQNITFEKNYLKVSGTQATQPVDFVSYGNDIDACKIFFNKSTKAFEIFCPIFTKNAFVILDLLKLPMDLQNVFEESPNFESGYLVFMSHNDIKYRDVNYFIKNFLLKVLEDIL